MKKPQRTRPSIGDRIGRLLVLRMSTKTDSNGSKYWLCSCDCGTKTTVRGSRLTGTVKTRSCGCLGIDASRKKNTIHGMSRSPEHIAWSACFDRCYNPNHKGFHNYGGRGITVCERWKKSFVNFLADMGPRPSPNHSIDRKDNNGNYEPTNCRWATIKEQCRNRRGSRLITVQSMTITVAEFCERFNFPRPAIYARLNHGWSGDRLLAPLLNYKKRSKRLIKRSRSSQQSSTHENQ